QHRVRARSGRSRDRHLAAHRRDQATLSPVPRPSQGTAADRVRDQRPLRRKVQEAPSRKSERRTMMITERVVVSAIEPEDIPTIVQWRNEPEIYAGFVEYEPLNTVGQRMFLERLTQDKSRRLW